MNVRDLGLIAIGVTIGVSACVMTAGYLAADIARADYIARAIALKYRGPRVQGEG